MMDEDDAWEIYFGLGPLDGAADHAYCHNRAGVNRATSLINRTISVDVKRR